VRLICFPYAGASAAIYRQLPKLLPELEVVAMELPGRGRRLSEPAHADMDRLVETLMAELAESFNAPFAMLGHSMGAGIAFEIACRLGPERRDNLRHLFLAARGAPGSHHTMPSLREADDRTFWKQLREFGGTPPAVLDDPELMELVLPTLRADFALIERYTPPIGRRIAVNLTAFAGTRDVFVPVTSIDDWRQSTSGSFRLHTVEGDHFFLDQAMAGIAAVIARRLDHISLPNSKDLEYS
jgi:medium-chain acyl-[acyl-carrier-protein] hydrolase